MGSRCLLVSDLDGTLLGDDEALKEFADWCRGHPGAVRLVYNSGRFLASVAEAVRTTPLPPPEAVVGGVGTEIHVFADGRRLDGWPCGLGRWSGAEVRNALAACGRLELQPDEFQSDYKASYYAHDLDEGDLQDVERRLNAAGLDAQLVYSSARDLDVLPQGIDKGAAARFLAERWGFRPEQVIVAGDTGNDLSMFRQGFRGVVVANAHEALKAIRSPDVYHARRPFAAGVLDGVRHWMEG